MEHMTAVGSGGRDCALTRHNALALTCAASDTWSKSQDTPLVQSVDWRVGHES